MALNPYLHVIGVDPRRIVHAVLFDNANWTSAGNVEEKAGNPGFIRSATAEDTVLHVFVATRSIFQAIGNADGSWTPFENTASKSRDGWLGASQVAAAIAPRIGCASIHPSVQRK